MILADVRDDIAAALAPLGIQVHKRLPGSITSTPAVTVRPDRIRYSTSFDDSTDMRLAVGVLVAIGDWDDAQVTLDDLIDPDGDLIAALHTHDGDFGYRVVDASEYGVIAYNDEQFLGAVLTVDVLA